MLELLTGKEKLQERIRHLESLADVRLVFELQRELQRERRGRDAERKAHESDVIRSRDELSEAKERCRALEDLSEVQIRNRGSAQHPRVSSAIAVKSR
jgi:hypothetical protein